MLNQSDYMNDNKIEQCLNGILSDCYRQKACKTNKCINIEYQMIVVNI